MSSLEKGLQTINDLCGSVLKACFSYVSTQLCSCHGYGKHTEPSKCPIVMLKTTFIYDLPPFSKSQYFNLVVYFAKR